MPWALKHPSIAEKNATIETIVDMEVLPVTNGIMEEEPDDEQAPYMVLECYREELRRVYLHYSSLVEMGTGGKSKRSTMGMGLSQFRKVMADALASPNQVNEKIDLIFRTVRDDTTVYH